MRVNAKNSTLKSCVIILLSAEKINPISPGLPAIFYRYFIFGKYSVFHDEMQATYKNVDRVFAK